LKIRAIERQLNSIRIINQTRLPDTLEYRQLDDYRKVIGSIKRLEVRGAPAIGIAGAYALALAVNNTPNDLNAILRVADEIKNARPTAVNLAWAVDRTLNAILDLPEHLRPIVVWEEADRIHKEDVELCRKIGENGAKLLKDGDNILTHCNTGVLATGGIGTALGVIYTSRDQGRKHHVYVDETRPLLQGARLTAWELMQENIDCTLITDSMAGMLMGQGKIDCVIVGADRIAADGSVANKIGTYSLAVLARAHEIPFYVAAPHSTFDDSTPDGASIPIEERDPEELSHLYRFRTAPVGVNIYNPAFDITPKEYVTAYISDKVG
jgi:methylthioribose-1-phosphate isomerase